MKQALMHDTPRERCVMVSRTYGTRDCPGFGNELINKSILRMFVIPLVLLMVTAKERLDK